MARFVRHESCPKCGSRDNLGRYDDGSAFCFGCHYYEARNGHNFIPPAVHATEHGIGQVFSRGNDVASRASFTLPEQCLDWASKFGITLADLIRAGARWDPRTESLIFLYYDKSQTLCCIQGRSFSNNPQATKYHNWGSTHDVIDINGSHGKTIVITEDKLSAIKVARVADAFPALGTTFQIHKLVTLKQLGYQRVVVWLDYDKWRESQEIADKAKWIGLSSTSVLSEEDPKCYDEDTIRKYLT